MNRSMLFALCLLAASLLISCKSEPKGDKNTFGAGVSNTENPSAFAEVVSQLDTRDSVNVIMKAKVENVCQKKGCWMTLLDNQGATDEQLFVKFKDYAFFVPMDIAGREVIVEGIAYTEETSVDELRHYAEDAKKSPEEIAAITEPIKEKKFMATGVVLLQQ